jgi:hypothetical protein
MSFHRPTCGPESWQELLADPQKHWVSGYSARTLAHCWEDAKGLPPEIAALFGGHATLLLAIPEHKVELPGGSRPSQTDLFALVRWQERTGFLRTVPYEPEGPGRPPVRWTVNPVVIGRSLAEIAGIQLTGDPRYKASSPDVTRL